MQTVADIERPLKERIAALEAERDDIDARLRELYDEYTNRQEGWNSERDALTAENERLKVEINRLETALEFCRDGDKTPETGDYKTPKQVATAALAGHKTVMQQRWEWQGAAIQEAKHRADAAEAKLAEIDAYVRSAHNGYDPESRKMMDGLQEPATTLQAIRELVEEGIELGDAAVRIQLQAAEAKLAAVREIHDSTNYGCDIGRKLADIYEIVKDK